MVTKRGGKWYGYFRPFGGRKVGIVLERATSKDEAERIFGSLSEACRSGNFHSMGTRAREVAVRLFKNRGWEMPSPLRPAENYRPAEELTLWKAAELFLTYPGIEDHPGKWRYKCCLTNLIDAFGGDRSIKSIWIPDLRLYQVERQRQGAAAATINRELSTLSGVFRVLQELQVIEGNPVRLMKRLSERAGERQVYLSYATVVEITDRCPAWYRPILWTAYYTGMRRGEILSLKREQVNLATRIVKLSPEDVKERNWKRVPLHQDLVMIAGDALRWGFHTVKLEAFKNCWERACKKLNLPAPWPRFHDLRHTWKTNARRSGMHPEIERAIMGHSDGKRSVHERYGRISDKELLDAIDRMTFDHGETEIWVARHCPATAPSLPLSTPKLNGP